MIVADFQGRVAAWASMCFGQDAGDRKQRTHRFLEEALELAQSLDCTHEEAIELVDHVFGKPIGEPYQEMGGVMVTLAALANAAGLKMGRDGEEELRRISTLGMIERIRRKHASRPASSPLPGNAEAANG
jgi:NTP pyrophosphatase (non-canonical NTP hydrolase)